MRVWSLCLVLCVFGETPLCFPVAKCVAKAPSVRGSCFLRQFIHMHFSPKSDHFCAFEALAHFVEEKKIFSALLLASVVGKCPQAHHCQKMARKCEKIFANLPRREFLHPYHRLQAGIMTGYSFRRLVMRNYARMLYSNYSHTSVDVLTVSISSDGSDMAAFGAAVASSMTVMSLVPVVVVDDFATSPVRLAVFPDEVRENVEMAAVFLRDFCLALDTVPQYVFAGDDAAILALAWLATHIYKGDRQNLGFEELHLLATLERSLPFWPPQYPPVHLSKLFTGLHDYTPPKVEIFREGGSEPAIWPDLDMVLSKAQVAFGVDTRSPGAPIAFMKKEYSGRGLGVRRTKLAASAIGTSLSQLLQEQLVPLQLFDSTLPVRIFLEKQMPNLSHQVTVRFFARHGALVAAHLDHVDIDNGFKDDGNLSTVRNAVLEERMANLVRHCRFNGFGAVVWLFDRRQKPYLFEFRARPDRWTCIGHALAAISANASAPLRNCPCVALQTQDNDTDAPRFVDANVHF